MPDYKKVAEKMSDCGIEAICNEPLSLHTTFKIGGPAALFISAKNENQLIFILNFLKNEDADYFIIGNGSNLLVSDKGYNGAVISLDGDFTDINLVDENTVFCGAGVKLSALCTFALENGLSGLEFAYGIPGTAGGAVYMNAGAYGGEMKDVILSVNHITESLMSDICPAEKLNLSYRHSVYSENKFVITGLTVKLKKDDKALIKERMNDFIQRRKDKQPLNYPSAGSVFKRPEGNYAGALIEKCGLKGYSLGGAQVSEKHAGFIINKDNATAEDVLNLVYHIQKAVLEDSNIMLECEIKTIGI